MSSDNRKGGKMDKKGKKEQPKEVSKMFIEAIDDKAIDANVELLAKILKDI